MSDIVDRPEGVVEENGFKTFLPDCGQLSDLNSSTRDKVEGVLTHVELPQGYEMHRGGPEAQVARESLRELAVQQVDSLYDHESADERSKRYDGALGALHERLKYPGSFYIEQDGMVCGFGTYDYENTLDDGTEVFEIKKVIVLKAGRRKGLSGALFSQCEFEIEENEPNSMIMIATREGRAIAEPALRRGYVECDMAHYQALKGDDPDGEVVDFYAGLGYRTYVKDNSKLDYGFRSFLSKLIH